MSGNGKMTINLRTIDRKTISVQIPRDTSTWGQVYEALGRKLNINPKTKTIFFEGKFVDDNTPINLSQIRFAETIYLVDRPRSRWTSNIDAMVKRGEMTEEQANKMMGNVRGHNNRESKRDRIARIEERIAENMSRITELMRENGRLQDEKRRLEAEVRASQRNGAAGTATGGRKKRRTKRKSKAHMTKQKRKVNGVTRTVRVSSTGRKYVLLKGRKHYL